MSYPPNPYGPPPGYGQPPQQNQPGQPQPPGQFGPPGSQGSAGYPQYGPPPGYPQQPPGPPPGGFAPPPGGFGPPPGYGQQPGQQPGYGQAPGQNSQQQPSPVPPPPVPPSPVPEPTKREPQFVRHEVPVATVDFIAGSEIVETLGEVMGVVTRPRDMSNAPDMSTLILEARQDAVARMVELARSAGADAVVGLRFDGGKVSDGASEVTAYGTAVKLAGGVPERVGAPDEETPTEQT